MNKNSLVKIYKNNFGFPNTINWGHSMFLCSVGTLIIYLIQSFVIRTDTFYKSTSLVGYFITSALLTTIALLLPVATLFIEKRTSPKSVIVDSVGSFTGIGVLLLSMFSGCALPLIKIPLHNLSTWLWLKAGNTIVFPAFFNVNDGSSVLEKTLSYFATTAIPSFGIALFFTGLMWACLPKKKERLLTYLIIAFSFAVFSLNPADFAGLFVCGIWICFLREKSNNVYAPLLALLSCGGMELFITKYVISVDITMVQVYSDMGTTYLFSSLPAFAGGLILLLVFSRYINEFANSYFLDFSKDDMNKKEDDSKSLIRSGINLGLITGIIIFIVLWHFVFKGGIV